MKTGKLNLLVAMVCLGLAGTGFLPGQTAPTAPTNKVRALAMSQGGASTVKAPAKSIEQLNQEVQASPTAAAARLALGQAYMSAKDYVKAREQLRLAVRLGKGSPEAQRANHALMSLPHALVKPKTGAETRMIASMLGLGRTRGAGGAARPTVIDFYASWCQPCKQLDGVMGRLLKDSYSDKVKYMRVDVDDPNSQALLDQYEVSPIPTVVFLNSEGEVVSYSVGFSGEHAVRDGLSKITATSGSGTN